MGRLVAAQGAAAALAVALALHGGCTRRLVATAEGDAAIPADAARDGPAGAPADALPDAAPDAPPDTARDAGRDIAADAGCRAGCVIAGRCHAAGAPDPTNTCRACQPRVSRITWTSRAKALCDDGDTCTRDACDPKLGCRHTRVTGGCVIAGVCWPEGTPRPGDRCQVCRAASSSRAWTRIRGACDDGDACTFGDTCKTGTCRGTAYGCSDKLTCTADVCDGKGGCGHTLKAGSCLIGGTCHAKKASRTALGCDICDPAKAPRAWTELVCVRTLAGGGSWSWRDGRGTSASFADVSGIVLGAGKLYVSDQYNRRIRVVDTATRVVSTLAGSGTRGFKDGPAKTAQFGIPDGLALSGRTLYVSDVENHRIRAVDTVTGTVSTFAGSGTAGHKDGPARSARFNAPTGLALSGRTLYVAEWGNHRIRTVNTSTGIVSTLAGSGVDGYKDGAASTAQFSKPSVVALGGRVLYVSDQGNRRIRAVDTLTGAVSTIAGSGASGTSDGPALKATFEKPSGLVVRGTLLLVTDYAAGHIRVVELSTRVVRTLIGTGTGGSTALWRDGPPTVAVLISPDTLALAGRTLYVSDNATIRTVRLPR